MLVKLRGNTRYDGDSISKGQVIEVDQDVAVRWIKAKIAVEVKPKVKQVTEYEESAPAPKAKSKSKAKKEEEELLE